jgi:hypothetical protein
VSRDRTVRRSGLGNACARPKRSVNRARLKVQACESAIGVLILFADTVLAHAAKAVESKTSKRAFANWNGSRSHRRTAGAMRDT